MRKLKTDEVEKFNREQKEKFKEYPDLLECMKQYRMGNRYFIENCFYEYQYYFKNSVITRNAFFDPIINEKLKKIKRDFCYNYYKEFAADKYNGKSVYMNFKNSPFDENEIEYMLYDYIKGLCNNQEFELRGLKETRSYVIRNFRNKLIREAKERVGIKIRENNHLEYEVKIYPDIALWHDVTLGKDENGANIKLDNIVYGKEDKYFFEENRVYFYQDKTSRIILENRNWRNILTPIQVEKIDIAVKYMEEFGYDDFFDKEFGMIVIKTKLGKIWFPDRKGSTIKDVNNIFKSMISRVNKELAKHGEPPLIIQEKPKKENKEIKFDVCDIKIQDSDFPPMKYSITKRHYSLEIMSEEHIYLKFTGKEEYKEVRKIIFDKKINTETKLKLIQEKFKKYLNAA